MSRSLAELKHQGIVASRRGKQGGYLLLKPADEITYGEILRIIDGPIRAAALPVDHRLSQSATIATASKPAKYATFFAKAATPPARSCVLDDDRDTAALPVGEITRLLA